MSAKMKIIFKGLKYNLDKFANECLTSESGGTLSLKVRDKKFCLNGVTIRGNANGIVNSYELVGQIEESVGMIDSLKEISDMFFIMIKIIYSSGLGEEGIGCNIFDAGEETPVPIMTKTDKAKVYAELWGE